MSQSAIIWVLILSAFVTANLPFVNARLMTVVPLRSGRKSLGMRLAELVLWYFVIGVLGLALEKSAGQIYQQGWEFYAVTAALFATFAFPGFVFRYLTRRGG